MQIIIIIIIIMTCYKICLRRTFLDPNTSTFQQILVADTNLAERQFLHEKQTLNKGKSLIYRAGTVRPGFNVNLRMAETASVV
jgi:hypothetical protein